MAECTRTCHLIWTLGIPDNQTSEFVQDWFTRTDPPRVVLTIGIDDPSISWSAFHPGPYDARSGYREHPFTICFHLDEPVGDAYRLVVHLLLLHSSIPQLLIDVNGWKALYFVERDAFISARDRPRTTNFLSGECTLSIYLPSAVLHRGENILTLVCVDSELSLVREEKRPATSPARSLFGCGLIYDAIQLFLLDYDSPSPPQIILTPTPFYQEHSGKLVELVKLTIRLETECHDLQAAITVDSQHLHTNFDLAGRSAGDFRAWLWVEEIKRPSTATVTVMIDGQSYTCTLPFRPCRRWTLHLMPHVHLDIGYTDFQAKIAELHSRNLDRVLAIQAHTPDYAFSIDGTWIMQNYLATRQSVQVDAILTLLRQKRLGLQAFYATFLTGLASLEECYRAAYFGHHLRREYDIPLLYANLTDVPSYSWALPSILADLGIPAFLGLVSHIRATTDDSDHLHLISPFRWQGPDGKEILAFFSYHFVQLRMFAGDPPFISTTMQRLLQFLSIYDRDDYIPCDLPIVGTHGDNEDLGGGERDFVDRWNSTFTYPKMQFSTPNDYFAAIVPNRKDLPILRGDGGSFWEDGVGAAAQAISVYRRAQGLMAVAETLAALVSTVSYSFKVPRKHFDEAWEALLLGCEHTWTWSHGTRKPDSVQEWKEQTINWAYRLASDGVRMALSHLGELATTHGPALIIFNSLSWPRSGTVELDLANNVHVKDTNGQNIPVRIIHSSGAYRHVQLYLEKVPALGYQILILSKSEMVADTEKRQAYTHCISEIVTDYYSLTFDPTTHRICTLSDRVTGQQILDSEAPYMLGDVVYVVEDKNITGDEINHNITTLLQSYSNLPQAALQINKCTWRESDIQRIPWGWRIFLTGHCPSLPRITVEIVLYERSRWIDVQVEITKEPVVAKEAVYIAFPFALREPQLRYDRQLGWVDPAQDHLTGACNEWFTTQHAVTLWGDQIAITWSSADAPLWTVGDFVRGHWPIHFVSSSGMLFSYVMNNYWSTNYPAYQKGHINLHYAFTVGDKWEPLSAACFGREVRCPLVVGEITALDKTMTGPSILPTSGTSLLHWEGQGILAGVQAAQDGCGLIARCQEVTGQEATGYLQLSFARIVRAWRCSAAEDNEALLPVRDGTVTVNMPPFGVTTIRILFEKHS